MRNLDALNKTVGEFENPSAVENYFIGALSTMVSAEIWDECLKSAERCALAHGLEKKQTVEA